MKEQPLAFMSYSRSDDENDNGYLTKFCKILSGEVHANTGVDFKIFQDTRDIKWGQNWERIISDSLQSVMLLIPIITPSFLNSDACRKEMELFLEREKKLDRDDLILPLYYIACPQMNGKSDESDERLIKAIRAHHCKDWTNLRFKPLENEETRTKISELAKDIRDVIERVRETTFDKPQLKMLEIEGDLSYSQNGSNYSANLASDRSVSRTFIVDVNLGREKYSKIRDAIADADSGDKIIIHPGIYNEGLILEKELQIIGDGEKGAIVIQAEGQSVLSLAAEKCSITGVSLKQMGGGKLFCIDIIKGSPRIEDCDIVSDGSACIGIHNKANPLIRRNRIYASKQSGVLVFDGGEGFLEENEIFGNAYAGVEVRNSGNPIFLRNIIRDGNQNGILVFDDGRGVFESNDIYGNNYPQVLIFRGGNPLFRRNKIHDGKQNAVFIFDYGQGLFEDNDIFNNDYPELAIRSKGNPIFRHNKIHSSKQNGILIYDSGFGLFEDNDIFNNDYPGVAIKINSNPIFRHNRIYNNKENGIFIYDSSFGLFEDNDIFNNDYPGVAIKINSNPIFRHNRIYNNKQNGIFIFDKGSGVFEDNDIFGNEYPELAIGAGSNPILRHNRIHNGKLDGILIKDSGKGLLEDNDIFSNARAGVLILSGGNPMILRNRINENSSFGILIEPGGSGVIEDNDLRNNKPLPIFITQDSVPKVRLLRNLEKDP